MDVNLVISSVSLFVGILSFGVGIWTFIRTGSIKKALEKKQSELLNKAKFQESLPKLKECADLINASRDDNEALNHLLSIPKHIFNVATSTAECSSKAKELATLIKNGYSLDTETGRAQSLKMIYLELLMELISEIEKEC